LSHSLKLEYAKPARGIVIVDQGAARALRDGAASLLPVGVTEVKGEFDAGDAVEILERSQSDGERPRSIAKGICSYSAAELRQVLGLNSEGVRGILPHAAEEAVHRDYLVLD
jgi:glutamate 5-kinase